MKNKKLYSKIYRKKTDTQAFLIINSEHPTSLKNNILYSQDVPIKRICSTARDSKHNTTEVKKRFVKQVNNHKLINEPIHKVQQQKQSRCELLK